MNVWLASSAFAKEADNRGMNRLKHQYKSESDCAVPKALALSIPASEGPRFKRVLEAKAQYLQATLYARSGKTADAGRGYRAVVGILDGIGKEDGAGKVLGRADLAGIYADAQKGSK